MTRQARSGYAPAMGRWTEQAQWVGPTPNQSGPMSQQRGMVLHVMQGSLAGSIAWGKNSASQVSFHFGTSKAGAIQQLVDTDITAWTQGAGNGSWVSVENEDFSGNPLSAPQLEGVAQLYARGVREYGWMYGLANSPSGFGLGYHAMGGVPWGNHPDCPGQPIIDQRQAILDRARQINGSTPPVTEDTDMSAHRIRSGASDGSIYFVPGYQTPTGKMAAFGLDGPADVSYYAFPLVQLPDGVTVAASGRYDVNAPVPLPVGTGGTGGATPTQVATAVRAELDKTKLAGL